MMLTDDKFSRCFHLRFSVMMLITEFTIIAFMDKEFLNNDVDR